MYQNVLGRNCCMIIYDFFLFFHDVDLNIMISFLQIRTLCGSNGSDAIWKCGFERAVQWMSNFLLNQQQLWFPRIWNAGVKVKGKIYDLFRTKFVTTMVNICAYTWGPGDKTILIRGRGKMYVGKDDKLCTFLLNRDGSNSLSHSRNKC